MNQRKFISLLSLVIFKFCFYNLSFFSYAGENSSVYAGLYEGVMIFHTGGDAFFPLYTEPNNYFFINQGNYLSTLEFGGFIMDGGRGEFRSKGLFYSNQGTFIPLPQVKYIAFKLGNQFIPVPLFPSNDHSVSLNWEHSLNEEGRIILEFKLTGISSKTMVLNSGNSQTDYHIQGTIREDGKIHIEYQSEHLSIVGAGVRGRGFQREKCTRAFFEGKRAPRIHNSSG